MRNRFFCALLCLPWLAFAYHQSEENSIQASKERMKGSAYVAVSGKNNTAASSQSRGTVVEEPGQKVFKQFCSVCHSSGVAGAPKVGNREQWMERYQQGWDLIMQRATQGYRGMPAKGHCHKCSNQDLREAIEYMLKNSDIEPAQVKA